MNRIIPASNRKLFEYANHVWEFMGRCHILPGGGKVWLGVSGGLDSMALLYLFRLMHFQKKISEFSDNSVLVCASLN